MITNAAPVSIGVFTIKFSNADKEPADPPRATMGNFSISPSGSSEVFFF